MAFGAGGLSTNGISAGAAVRLRCLGDVPGVHWLDGRTVEGTVALVANPSGLSGTRWRVHDAGDGAIRLECLGDIPGVRWLDGRTVEGTVALVADPSGLSGTRWSAFPADEDSVSKRPFYAIAHQCNTPEAVTAALAAGANAIECDFRLRDGELVIGHPPLPNPFRDWTPLVPYLQRVAEIGTRYPSFALQIFDCKDSVTSNADFARALLTAIRTQLTAQSGIAIIISVASLGERGFFDGIYRDLRDREGIAIDEENDPSAVSGYFRALGVRNHAYANGIDALLPGPNVRPSVREAIRRRQEFQSKLIYVWTLARRDAMRDYLRMGVDGILVNDVPSLREVLREPEFADCVRLAGRDELAFGLPTMPAYEITVRTGDRGGAGTDANVFVTVNGDLGTTGEFLLDTPGHHGA